MCSHPSPEVHFVSPMEWLRPCFCLPGQASQHRGQHSSVNSGFLGADLMSSLGWGVRAGDAVTWRWGGPFKPRDRRQ